MKPERLKTAGVDCEFDKIDLKEAIKLAVTMHTNSRKLQAEIIAQDMSYEKMVEKARAIELTKKTWGIRNKQRKHSKWKQQQLMQLEGSVNFNTKEIHNQDPRLFVFVTDQVTSIKGTDKARTVSAVENISQINMTAGQECHMLQMSKAWSLCQNV